jgi:hypothetical protein
VSKIALHFRDKAQEQSSFSILEYLTAVVKLIVLTIGEDDFFKIAKKLLPQFGNNKIGLVVPKKDETSNFGSLFKQIRRKSSLR